MVKLIGFVPQNFLSQQIEMEFCMQFASCCLTGFSFTMIYSFENRHWSGYTLFIVSPARRHTSEQTHNCPSLHYCSSHLVASCILLASLSRGLCVKTDVGYCRWSESSYWYCFVVGFYACQELPSWLDTMTNLQRLSFERSGPCRVPQSFTALSGLMHLQVIARRKPPKTHTPPVCCGPTPDAPCASLEFLSADQN